MVGQRAQEPYERPLQKPNRENSGLDGGRHFEVSTRAPISPQHRERRRRAKPSCESLGLPRVERIRRVQGCAAVGRKERLAVEATHPPIERQTRRGARVAVRLRRGFPIPGGNELCGVFAAEPRKVGLFCEIGPRPIPLVLAEHLWSPRVEPREVKKAQRRAVHHVARAGPADRALVQVPVRDVTGRVAQDGVLEVRRERVKQPLIDEETFLDRDDAVAA